jgi:hypothetical protein
MNRDALANWTDDNQRYLTAALSSLYDAIEHRLRGDPPPDDSHGTELHDIARGMSAPPAVERLCAVFGLSPFERAVLLVCAGIELDSRFAKLLAAQGGPTFGLALGLLPGAHWTALTPAAPLRHWRLLELGPGGTLTQSSIRIDERILHYLAGASHLDDRLAGFLVPLPSAVEAVPSHRALAQRIADAWSGAAEDGILPLVQLYGEDRDSRCQVAACAGKRLGLGLWSMRADSLPAETSQTVSLMRLWEREAFLERQVLLLGCDDADMSRVRNWIEGTRFPLIVSTRERIPISERQVLSLEIRKPTTAEQSALWREALGSAADAIDGRMDEVVANFDMGAQGIWETASGILETGARPRPEIGETLWQACRMRAQPRLGELAQRIRPTAGWNDLVLPERQMQSLREIAIHVRRRMKVYEGWGFSQKSSRGLGISVLFAGSSGTGKTMAAEVLANDLRLDLYRIDLSQVVSKYIGETEKNLRRLFDAAEAGGAILLFDEADAIFGKRSEVKDSHDRYANIEVSYLLQRMEEYRGLAILTTNMKEAIDTAFLRRIRFVVQFPFPDGAQRAEIWRRIFPAQTPTEGVEVSKLARLSITGGNIHNIALYAAFLAADADEPVRMTHLLRAVRAEFTKIERPVNEAELGGWA